MLKAKALCICGGAGLTALAGWLANPIIGFVLVAIGGVMYDNWNRQFYLNREEISTANYGLLGSTLAIILFMVMAGGV